MVTAGDEARDDDTVHGYTRKQLAHQVEKGRRITFIPPPGGDGIVGYLAGWDPPEAMAHNWFVLEPAPEGGFCSHLVPQEGTRMVLHSESTFDSEPARAEMDPLVRGFKARVSREVLHRRGSGAGDRMTQRR